jgi:hypothetical protein
LLRLLRRRIVATASAHEDRNRCEKSKARHGVGIRARVLALVSGLEAPSVPWPTRSGRAGTRTSPRPHVTRRARSCAPRPRCPWHRI